MELDRVLRLRHPLRSRSFFWRRVRGHRVQAGSETLIGKHAVVAACRPLGQVVVDGEQWEARCADGAGTGETVTIVSRDGLVLVVERSVTDEELDSDQGDPRGDVDRDDKHLSKPPDVLKPRVADTLHRECRDSQRHRRQSARDSRTTPTPRAEAQGRVNSGQQKAKLSTRNRSRLRAVEPMPLVDALAEAVRVRARSRGRAPLRKRSPQDATARREHPTRR